MTAIAWSLFGLMAVALTMLAAAFFMLVGRIDALSASLSARIDRLTAQMRE